MRHPRLLGLPILTALTLLLGANPSSAATPTYQNTITMHLPSTLNQLTAFDISFVDSSRSTYVLADRNNASIDVFDTQDDRFVRASDSVFTGLGTGAGCKTGTGPNTTAVTAVVPTVWSSSPTDAGTRTARDNDLTSDGTRSHRGERRRREPRSRSGLGRRRRQHGEGHRPEHGPSGRLQYPDRWHVPGGTSSGMTPYTTRS